MDNDGSDVFGAYASTFWLGAYGSGLQGQPWTWADPTDVDGATSVPSTIGQLPADAGATLTQAGFVVATAATPCGSSRPPGTVAYYQPQQAAPGSTITLCLSSGVPAGN